MASLSVDTMAKVTKQMVKNLMNAWFIADFVPRLLNRFKREALSLAPFAGDVRDMVSRGIITMPSSRGRQVGTGTPVGTGHGGRFIPRGLTIKQYISNLRPQITFPMANLVSSTPKREVAQFGWIRNRPGRGKGKFEETRPATHKFHIADVILGKQDATWKVEARQDRTFPILNPAPGIYARVMLKKIKAHWVWVYAEQAAKLGMQAELNMSMASFRAMHQSAV